MVGVIERKKETNKKQQGIEEEDESEELATTYVRTAADNRTR